MSERKKYNMFTLYNNILQYYFTADFKLLPKHYMTRISPPNFFVRLMSVLRYSIAIMKYVFAKHGSEEMTDIAGKNWLFVSSINQQHSIEFLMNKLPDTIFTINNYTILKMDGHAHYRLITRRKWLYYYKFFPVFIYFLFTKGKYAIRFFDQIYLSIGFYESFEYLLKKYRPKSVIFANDHNHDNRSMLLAANKLGVKTIYIQHATPSINYPALEFSLSLLEGQAAWDTYKNIGPISGQVELIGMPKFDKYVNFRNTEQKVARVGICSNPTNTESGIITTVKKLVEKFPDLQFTFRPHPSDKRAYKEILGLPNVKKSDPTTEKVFDFLRQQDLIIVGNSNIHIEAVLINVVSVYYNFDDDPYIDDVIGFSQKLYDKAADLNELIAIVEENSKHKKDVFMRAKYYNALVGEDKEGNSVDVAIEKISTFIKS